MNIVYALFLLSIWLFALCAVVGIVILVCILTPEGPEYKTPPNTRIWGESRLPSRFPNKSIWG